MTGFKSGDRLRSKFSVTRDEEFIFVGYQTNTKSIIIVSSDKHCNVGKISNPKDYIHDLEYFDPLKYYYQYSTGYMEKIEENEILLLI